MKLTKQTVYLPFNGGSLYGKGIIREKYPNDTNIHKYVFENKKGGKIYFNSISDKQIKGLQIIFTPEQLNQLLSDVIKDALNTAADNAYVDNNHKQGCSMDSDDFEVNKESITNTFEEVFNKFKV